MTISIEERRKKLEEYSAFFHKMSECIDKDLKEASVDAFDIGYMQDLLVTSMTGVVLKTLNVAINLKVADPVFAQRVKAALDPSTWKKKD